ncbi:MAG: TonB-dependent receptor [Bacteroidetes bacterium]|nr:TonB-dependent receptor [Bacteroidota bacterium]
MLRSFIFNISLILSLSHFSQGFLVTGKVQSSETGKTILGALIRNNQNKALTKTDSSGNFTIECTSLPVGITLTADGFERQEQVISSEEFKVFSLETKQRTMNTVVVSAGRRDQKIEEIPISIDIIKPSLIVNKGLTNLAQAVDQSPGVYVMDGQVSIRGGGGYAYGAGSRVMLLWNGIPMLSPDVGDAKWNAIPMEQASQIEVLKGASSVLYGSGALNGIIALNEREPGPEGIMQARVQSGLYTNPRRKSMQWWGAGKEQAFNPMFHLADVYYGKSLRNIGFTLGANGFYTEAYRQGEMEKRGRINGSFFYRPLKENARFKAGLSYNFQWQDVGIFVLWKNDSMGYQAMDNSLSRQRAIRFNIDPYFRFIDGKKGRHHVRTRYYLVTTGNEGNVVDASFAQMYYLDYQYQQKISEKGNLIFGITNTHNRIKSWVFGDHLSINSAAYGQWELKSNKWDFTGGLRLEYCQLDTLIPDSQVEILGVNSPVYPIARAGIHYEPRKGTHLRGSLGQGIRFPSVAERFVSTSVGGVVIFKNPNLRPETGYAGELGVKQVFLLGDWKAMADIAGFANYYSNMTEFTFGLYKPDSIVTLQTTDPNAIDYFYNWVGFQAQNAEEAFIGGFEISLNSEGKIKDVELTSLLGYTYMNPISLNNDSIYRLSFSDATTNMLKYRFNHMAKADVQATYKGISLGISARYNSFMKNIDAVFEDGILGQELLVGMDKYRAIYNQGVTVMDARIGYRISEEFKVNFIMDNLFNVEYVSRPGTVQPPRTLILQMQMSL